VQEIVVACIGLFASVVVASLSYYFTKKSQLKIEERQLKEEYYRFFIKALSDVAIDNKDDEAQKRLSEGFNSLIIMANANVVRKLMDFHNFVKLENASITRDSEEWSIKHDALLAELARAIREDLFGKKEEIEEFPPIHLVGRKFNKKI
jgi:hypothetical protein